MAREEKLPVQPFVVHALVKRTRQDRVIRRRTCRLFEEKRPIQCIQAHPVASADHNVSCSVVDPCTLKVSLADG